MSWKNAIKRVFDGWVRPNASTEGDPVFLLGPRRSGKTMFLASLFNTAEDELEVSWDSEATRAWKEVTMRPFFERKTPTNTDWVEINEFKEKARTHFHQLASSTEDEFFLKRMMLDVRLRFPSADSGMYRVCLPDPSGELFVTANLLQSDGYARYVDALMAATGYIVVVGADAEICKGEPGPQATAVQRVFNKLADHAGNSDYITRPVAVVMMKMDQHMECCLQCTDRTGPERTAFLRTAGLDSKRMGDLFERWFHRINRRGIESIVEKGMLRFFGVSAYGFAPDGTPACTRDGENFVPTLDAQPINLAEPLKWTLGVR